MKRGDLITLVGDPHGDTDLVEVGFDDRIDSVLFPKGTLALYMGAPISDSKSRSRWTRLDILVDGALGWVYLYEAGMIDEAR